MTLGRDRGAGQQYVRGKLEAFDDAVSVRQVLSLQLGRNVPDTRVKTRKEVVPLAMEFCRKLRGNTLLAIAVDSHHTHGSFPSTRPPAGPH